MCMYSETRAEEIGRDRMEPYLIRILRMKEKWKIILQYKESVIIFDNFPELTIDVLYKKK